MKIGIVGLGNIAQKAYLPVITSISDIEICLCSRNQERLDAISSKYRIPNKYRNLDSLISSGIQACFVHTATESHYLIVKKLLERGIHVYVDKPISYNYEETLSLYELARDNSTMLMTGFNRRYAPVYKDLIAEKPNMIIMEKNRMNNPLPPKVFVYDDFIHIVDTICYFMNHEVSSINVRNRFEGSSLASLAVDFIGRDITASGIMNRISGIAEESVEYFAADKKLSIKDMSTVITSQNNSSVTAKSNDWENTLRRKGFEGIIDHFIHCVQNDDPDNDNLETSLITHLLCEKILKQLEA